MSRGARGLLDHEPPALQNPSSSCTGNDYMHCPNNYASQGEIFYSQITSANAPPRYNVYAVDSCNGPEGVTGGNVGSPTGAAAGTALQQDMAGPPKPPPGQC